MAKKTIFDMGKNLRNNKDSPYFIKPPELSADFKIALDAAEKARDKAAILFGVLGVAMGKGYSKINWDSDPANPRNARAPQTFDGGTFIQQPFTYGKDHGRVIDLKPGEYSVTDAPMELPGVVDVKTRGTDNKD